MDAIQTQGLSYSYGPRRALDAVGLAVRSGEICGLLGPNGSGKTTLFRILATLLRPEAGAARILGLDVATEARAVRAAIGVAFQSPSVDRRLTPVENLRHHGHLYGLRGAELARRIDEALERVGLRERGRDWVSDLSGGQQRRVELAKCLLQRPRVLLLDEPSTGLDPAARRSFREHLRRLREQMQITALLTTHFMDEADACDHLVLLDAGRVVADDTPAALKAQIAGDCVVVHAFDPADLGAKIAERFGVQPAQVDDKLRLEQPRGHEWIARLVEAFGDAIQSISLARPTLEDVFIHRTGHRLGAEAG